MLCKHFFPNVFEKQLPRPALPAGASHPRTSEPVGTTLFHPRDRSGGGARGTPGRSAPPTPGLSGPRAPPVGAFLGEEKGTARTVVKLSPAAAPPERARAARSERVRGPEPRGGASETRSETRSHLWPPARRAVPEPWHLLKPSAPPRPPPSLDRGSTQLPGPRRPGRASQSREPVRNAPPARSPSPRPAAMASEELARKLQRRLLRGQAQEGGPEPASPAPEPAPEPEPPACAPTASADAELSAQLSRRLDINEGAARPRRCKVFNPYTEFPEFSRRLIKDLESMFKLYDSGRDGFIDLMELKLMMEKLGAPQTHLGLKSMIKEVDEDFDGKLSFREFLLIFHKAAAGELQEESGLLALAKLSEIDVALEGVKGAKDFFEAKVYALSSASKFEAELKAEQEERKREEEKRRLRQAAFRELKAAFST